MSFIRTASGIEHTVCLTCSTVIILRQTHLELSVTHLYEGKSNVNLTSEKIKRYMQDRVQLSAQQSSAWARNKCCLLQSWP